MYFAFPANAAMSSSIVAWLLYNTAKVSEQVASQTRGHLDPLSRWPLVSSHGTKVMPSGYLHLTAIAQGILVKREFQQLKGCSGWCRWSHNGVSGDLRLTFSSYHGAKFCDLCPTKLAKCGVQMAVPRHRPTAILKVLYWFEDWQIWSAEHAATHPSPCPLQPGA